MNYVAISKQISQAREVLNEWNEENPSRFVPWEWVEEMILARHKWQYYVKQKNKGKVQECHARYTEFRFKIPRPLIDRIAEQEEQSV